MTLKTSYENDVKYEELAFRFKQRIAYLIYFILKKKKAYLLISHRIPILRGQKGQRQSAFNFKVCIITKVCEEE